MTTITKSQAGSIPLYPSAFRHHALNRVVYFRAAEGPCQNTGFLPPESRSRSRSSLDSYRCGEYIYLSNHVSYHSRRRYLRWVRSQIRRCTTIRNHQRLRTGPCTGAKGGWRGQNCDGNEHCWRPQCSAILLGWDVVSIFHSETWSCFRAPAYTSGFSKRSVFAVENVRDRRGCRKYCCNYLHFWVSQRIVTSTRVEDVLRLCSDYIKHHRRPQRCRYEPQRPHRGLALHISTSRPHRRSSQHGVIISTPCE